MTKQINLNKFRKHIDVRINSGNKSSIRTTSSTVCSVCSVCTVEVSAYNKTFPLSMNKNVYFTPNKNILPYAIMYATSMIVYCLRWTYAHSVKHFKQQRHHQRHYKVIVYRMNILNIMSMKLPNRAIIIIKKLNEKKNKIIINTNINHNNKTI